MIRASPLKTGWTHEGAPSCWTPFTSTTSSSSAVAVPATLNLPGTISVDPRKMAANDGRRSSMPASGLAAAMLAV